MTDSSTTLVLGGNGKTGSRLVRRLTARDLPVRIGSRGGGLPFDWEDPSTWKPALQDIGSVYISFHPDLAVPGAVDTIADFCTAAVAAGVRRHVLLSGRGEEEARRCERAMAASGADWTVLRASWFDQNFSEGYLLEPICAGAVVLPADAVPEPFLDAEDIADAAMVVLTETGHIGATYELTGPRSLTFAGAVAEIADATGRDITYRPAGVEECTAGLPPEVADLLRYLFTTVLDGRNADVTDGVERLLRRPARDFTDFTRRTAAGGLWNATAVKE